MDFHTQRSYRAYLGAEAAANTDHVLVAADLVFTIMKPKKTDEVSMMSTGCPARQNCSSTKKIDSKTAIFIKFGTLRTLTRTRSVADQDLRK